MRIFLTGGNRGLGRHVKYELERRGHYVIAPTRERFDLIKDRVPDYQDIDVVIHAAAATDQDAKNVWATNFDGTKKMIEWCRKNSVRFVFISTGGVHNPTENAYLRSKQAAELLCSGSDQIIRPYFVYGQGTNNDRLITKMACALSRGIAIGVTTKRINPIYVTDLAGIIADVAEGKRFDSHIIEAGGPEVTTISHIARTMQVMIGSKTGAVVVLNDDGTPELIGDMMGHTRVEEGLKKTVEYLKMELI